MGGVAASTRSCWKVYQAPRDVGISAPRGLPRDRHELRAAGASWYARGVVRATPHKPWRSLWRLCLIPLLAGCLPEAAPYRCDLAGGDRACDGVAGSRCIEGSCAAPVSTSVCPSGFAFSPSSATPGRCAILPTADASVDVTVVDVVVTDTDPSATEVVAPDVPAPDVPAPDVPAPDVPALDAPVLDVPVLDVPVLDLGITPDIVSPQDVVVATDLPTMADTNTSRDVVITDVGSPPRDAGVDTAVLDAPNDAGPSFVDNPPRPVVQVVSGFLHTCARLDNQQVWCWGSNEQGQVGINASTLHVANPARVDIDNVVEIAAGAFHTCARRDNGEIRCWGRNIEGQLGVLTPRFAFAPVHVMAAPLATALALGAAHTCVATVIGHVFCWGSNRHGAIGVNSAADAVLTPTQVPVTGARFVVAGEAFTCAGGTPTVWCWGRNLYGEIGPSPAPSSESRVTSPVVITGAVAPNRSLDRLYAGGFTACAQSGTSVRCWGRTDVGTIPGSGAGSNQLTPFEVPHYAAALPTLGYTHQCSVDEMDHLRCWGANELGASGNGSVLRTIAPPTPALPFRVRRAEGVPVVGLGSAHACAVDLSGVLRCWGARYFGQLGDGRIAALPVPVEVPAWRNVTALTAGRAFTCARRSTGTLVCAGLNNVGQLGGTSVTASPFPTVEPGPVTVARGTATSMPLPGVLSVTAGQSHACATVSGNAVFCWGYNFFGQAAPLATMQNVVFGATEPLTGRSALSLAAGVAHTCALVASNSTLLCWGSNEHGESGQPLVTARVQGVVAPGFSGVAQVGAGDGLTCVRTTAGRVECFGANDVGQCGIGGTVPENVVLPSARVAAVVRDADDLAVGAQHACALVQGRVWCWGANHRGQLGDGTFTDRVSPVAVQLPSGESVAEVVTGEEHACARANSGRVYCWGSNHLGPLGLDDPLWILRAEAGGVRWPN